MRRKSIIPYLPNCGLGIIPGPAGGVGAMVAGEPDLARLKAGSCSSSSPEAKKCKKSYFRISKNKYVCICNTLIRMWASQATTRHEGMMIQQHPNTI